MRSLIAAMAVIPITRYRKYVSFIFFNMKAPKIAPTAMTGIIKIASAKDFKLILAKQKFVLSFLYKLKRLNITKQVFQLT